MVPTARGGTRVLRIGIEGHRPKGRSPWVLTMKISPITRRTQGEARRLIWVESFALNSGLSRQQGGLKGCEVEEKSLCRSGSNPVIAVDDKQAIVSGLSMRGGYYDLLRPSRQLSLTEGLMEFEGYWCERAGHRIR